MSPTASFLRRPISFLEQNILITPRELARAGSVQPAHPGAVSAAGGVIYVGLSKLDRIAGAGIIVRGIRNGAPCSVYQLVRRDPAMPSCCWPLDGSTLRVGPRSGSGDRLISSRSVGGTSKRRVQTTTVFGRISQVSKDWVFYAAKYECVAGPGDRCYYHKGLVSLLDAAA